MIIVKNARDVTSIKFHKNDHTFSIVIFMKFSLLKIVYVHKSHYENKY